jgi:tetratricopeptide (TPR) repeat protein
MVRIPTAFAAVLAACVLCVESTAAEKQLAPDKAVKQAEAKLARLMKEGDDRPSVYEARLELIRALRGLESCDTNQRVDAELAAITAWLDRTAVPVRLSPQLVYNELGRAAQARAACSDDPTVVTRAHETAIQAFLRASAVARADHDALNEAITLFNASRSAEALEDLPRAIELMERACAVDREYGLNDNYREDYVALVRLKDARSGSTTSPDAVERHLATLTQDKVSFAFKPQHGEQQRYRSEMRHIEQTNGQRNERRVDMEYSGLVAVQGDLVTVTLRPQDSKVSGRPAAAAVAAAGADLTPDELVARLLAQPLSYTVKTTGEFVGATGLDELRRVVLGQVDKAFAAEAAAPQREKARQLIEQLLSDSVINQQIASEWTMAVGWWIGAELDLGDWYTLDVDAPQPLQPGATLRHKYTFKVNRRLACSPADKRRSCVELVIEGNPEREQLADYLYAFITRTVGPLPRKQAKWFRERLREDVQVTERHVLVVDPATLRTHRQLRSKTTYIAAAERGGHPRLKLETTMSELQPAKGTAGTVKRQRETTPKTARNAAGGKS